MEEYLKKQNDFIKFEIKDINEINMKSIEIINKNKQLGLIEIDIEQFNEDISLIYNIKGLKTLKDYLLNSLSKEKTYTLLNSIKSNLAMQSYVLDTGIVSLDINYIYVKEINSLPYCYFIYVPINKEYEQDKKEINKVMFSIIISIEDNELRNEVLSLYTDGKIDEVIKLLEVSDITPEIKDIKINTENFHNNDESITCEVKEEETTLLDAFEETTLIDEDDYYISEFWGRILINNNGVLSEEHLYKDSNIIGRSLSSDIIIQSKVISKAHAKIFKIGSDFFLEDIGSKNGTFINDKKLRINEKVKITFKDKIKLGNVKCSFER